MSSQVGGRTDLGAEVGELGGKHHQGVVSADIAQLVLVVDGGLEAGGSSSGSCKSWNSWNWLGC